VAQPGETATLEVEGLSVELGIGGRWVRALNDVNLTVRPGEALGLVGESGSGKSLTALAVAGLLPDNARVVAGSIRLRGEEVLGRSEAQLNRLRGRSLAFIFQNPTSYLNPLLTIGAQIAEVFEVRPELLLAEGGDRLGRGARRELARRKVVEQRVVIAMALIRRPSLVIADEITTALDVTVQAQILSLLAELRASLGMTLLLITHDMGIVAQLADRVAVMYSGSVVEASDVMSLFAEARHPYARALLEAVPQIDGDATTLRAIPGGIPAITNPPPGCRFHLRCARVFEPCVLAVPTPVTLGERHSVACHLYGEGRV